MTDVDERVARRTREHELGLIRFLTQRARRLRPDLEQDLSRLRHPTSRIGYDDFDERFKTGWPARSLEASLRTLGAPEKCYVMATLPNFGPPHQLDGKLVPLRDAIAELVDTCELILSCVPGELVYVQEDPVISDGFAGIFKRQPRN